MYVNKLQQPALSVAKAIYRIELLLGKRKRKTLDFLPSRIKVLKFNAN